MIQRLLGIAINTFRESIRNRVVLGMVVLVVFVFLFAAYFAEMSSHEEVRVVKDFGVAGISLFGSLTAVILGIYLLYSEMQRRTIHTILSKPMHRYEFVLGKYLGMIFTLTALVIIFIVAMRVMLLLRGVSFDLAIAKALVLAYFKILIVAAIAIFFSAISSPFLSGIFTFSAYLLGHFTPQLASTSFRSGVLDMFATAGLKVIPDLHLFSISGGTVDGNYVSLHEQFVTWGYVGSAVGYALVFITILLLLAMTIFARRDFV